MALQSLFLKSYEPVPSCVCHSLPFQLIINADGLSIEVNGNCRTLFKSDKLQQNRGCVALGSQHSEELGAWLRESVYILEVLR